MAVVIASLQGLKVVVTGGVVGMTRPDVYKRLRDAGASIQDGIRKDTDLLILCADPNSNTGKAKQARDNGVAVITWGDAIRLMNGQPATPTEAPVAVPTTNIPNKPPAAYREAGPMFCKPTATTAIPSGPGWIYEVKADGWRCIAHVDGETILASRNGNIIARTGDVSKHAGVVAELDRLGTGGTGTNGVECVLDGELVVLDAKGRTDRQLYTKAGAEQTVLFFAYDVLEAQGVDVRNQPLWTRKGLLSSILRGGNYVRAWPIFTDDQALAAQLNDGGVDVVTEINSGVELLDYALREELEGIVCKKAASIYREGARNNDWLKVKLRVEQEFVVVGYTEGEGALSGTAGAFLLAYNSAPKAARFPVWTFCGSVGTGGTYDDRVAIATATTLADVGDLRLVGNDLTRAELRKVVWVKPEVVMDVKFQNWTEGGKLTHPSMQGMRTDKQATDVRKET